MIQLTREEVFAQWAKRNSMGITFGSSAILLTRDLREAKEWTDNGGTVLFFAHEVKHYGRFSRACGTGHSIFKSYERSTMAQWHSFLWAGDPDGQEPYEELPEEQQSSTFRIVIRSARQAGGTWFSWNLLETLTAHGVHVEWMGLSPDNPLPIWMHRADPRIHIGAKEQISNAAVQIIDATGADSPIDGNVVVVVTDGDPAKVVPDGGTDFILNRNPQGIPMYPETVLAMQTGRAVSRTVKELDSLLWDWFLKVRGLKTHPVDGSGEEERLVDKPVDKSIVPDSKETVIKEEGGFNFPGQETGFDFSDEEKGFDFDA